MHWLIEQVKWLIGLADPDNLRQLVNLGGHWWVGYAVLGAVIFGEVQGVFSDACNKAIEFGKPTLMRPDWKKVFEPQEIADSIQRIT